MRPVAPFEPFRSELRRRRVVRVAAGYRSAALLAVAAANGSSHRQSAHPATPLNREGIMRQRTPLAAALAAALLTALLTAPAPAQQKQPIERADQLPRHVYPVSATAMAVFQDPRQLAALAQRLEADLRADLAAYDIQDRATRKSYYGALSDLALLRSDYGTAVAYQDSIRAIEDKPGLRLTTGIVQHALAAAVRPPGTTPDTAVFRAALRREIAAVPYARAQAELAFLKARLERLTPNVAAGVIQSEVEPAARSGAISRELAQQLVGVRVAVDRILPVRGVVVEELTRTIAAHAVVKPDIWAARDISLDGRAGLTPVLIGIWDTGVDTKLFPRQLYTNAAEIPDNGKDDDGDGYVDDVHGIAHDLLGKRDTGMLFALSLTPDEETEYRALAKGALDQEAGLENPEVDAFRRKVGAMAPADFKPFREKLGEYIIWSHGTHVAGIALKGNPAARMLVARDGTDQFKIPPRPPSLEDAPQQAQGMREVIEYFRQRGVRVVNMSWGFGPDFFERDLEANNVGRTPEERRKLARQVFDIGAKALHDAMTAAPDILFVVAAGNWDQDNKFGEFVPAAFDLPNLITAGAVDRAGDEAAFTSYGKVDVYANGYEVRSTVPGGHELPLSGTSMAAPQVVNLAAKLLALKPALTTAELRRTILETADEKTIGAGKTIRLLNPKAAVETLTSDSALVLGRRVEHLDTVAMEPMVAELPDGSSSSPDMAAQARGRSGPSGAPGCAPTASMSPSGSCAMAPSRSSRWP